MLQLEEVRRDEMKGKVDRLSYELDVSQKDTRNVSSELFKVKSAYEETMLQLEEVRRENKTLSNEIKDIMDQITEGGRSIHEIDKIRKRLEAEKMELQSALEEAEATLEQEENKVLRCQMELTQVKVEIDRRIAEKDEEFGMVRKNQAKALDSMQAALETEAKGSLHGVQCFCLVFPNHSKFLILFSNATINLNLNLSELHLTPQNFVLLLFQCCLCFFKSRLQFHLFSLKTLSDLVNFMDRSSSFSDLIHDILDLI